MKALSLCQPWATLAILGYKKYETRSWATSYRGPLAIHASKGLGPVGGIEGLKRDVALSSYKRDALVSAGYQEAAALPLGAVLGETELTAVFQIYADYLEDVITRERRPLPDERERAFGDYTPGRFALRLASARAYPEPIPARGALGLWTWNGRIQEGEPNG